MQGLRGPQVLAKWPALVGQSATKGKKCKKGNKENECRKYGKYNKENSSKLCYKKKKFGKNSWTSGFPKSSLGYVQNVLESKKINYILIDRAHQYEVDEKMDFKNKNRYENFFELAHKNVLLQERALNIYNYLIENIDNVNLKSKIIRIEEILQNEEGKVCGN